MTTFKDLLLLTILYFWASLLCVGRRLKGTGVTTYSLHPGVIATQLGNDVTTCHPAWQRCDDQPWACLRDRLFPRQAALQEP
jgi:hypothetical protein